MEAPAAPPQVTKVLTFMVENHSLAQMRDQMPFTYALARKYAYADNYFAIRHPSLPNYLSIAAGSPMGVVDDRSPSAHRLRGTDVFDQAIARHKSAKIYVDSMGRNCLFVDSGRYAVRHNPWTYFVSGRANCRRYDVPVSRLAIDSRSGRLPNAGMVIPDLVHDAHDAHLAVSDAWIEAQVRRIQHGPDWISGHLAIVITADEDDTHSGNRVLTVVASRYQPPRVVHTTLNHYSLTRLYSAVTGGRFLRNAARAPSMRTAFGMSTPYAG